METAYGNLSQAAYEAIRAELARGEKILWVGQPDGGIRLTCMDIFLTPLYLLSAVGLYAQIILSTATTPVGSVVSGIPITLFLTYVLFGRYIISSVERKHTYYGVTNQRIIIVTKRLRKHIRSIMLPEVPADITLKQIEENKGTIMFEEPPFGIGTSVEWPGLRPYVPSFYRIEGAQAVYDTIKQAQLEANYGRGGVTGENTRAL